MQIQDQKVVQIHYTLTNDDGETLDSSRGKEPLTYIQGKGNIIPGLERALAGRQTGETLTAVVEPEDGYGVKNKDLIQSIPLTSFQDPTAVEVGARFQVQTSNGTHVATVTEIAEKTATLDLNHPLADERLHFAVEIMDIRTATADELAHGHAHGEGGHHH